jgi:hypothetical protein
MLVALEALERTRATLATKLRPRAAQKPAARAAMEQAGRKAQTTIDLHAKRVRHRLLLDDAILSARGVRPWEQDQNSP